MILNCGVGDDSWESLGQRRDPTSPSYRKSVLSSHWEDWCWSWNSNNLATQCEELAHLKRSWCWEGLKAEGEGDDRRWDDWMKSPTQWSLGKLWELVMDGEAWRAAVHGLQRVGSDWVTELKVTNTNTYLFFSFIWKTWTAIIYYLLSLKKSIRTFPFPLGRIAAFLVISSLHYMNIVSILPW